MCDRSINRGVAWVVVVGLSGELVIFDIPAMMQLPRR